MTERQGEAAAENLPQAAGALVEVVPGATPERGEDEARGPGETATVEVSLVKGKLNPAVKFRIERVPGYFPPKYHRVPIKP